MAEFCCSLVVAAARRGIRVPPGPVAQVLAVGLSLGAGEFMGQDELWGRLDWTWSPGGACGGPGLGVPLLCPRLKLDPKRNLAKSISQGLWIHCSLTTLSYKQGTHLKGPKKLYRMYHSFYDSLKGFLQSN